MVHLSYQYNAQDNNRTALLHNNPFVRMLLMHTSRGVEADSGGVKTAWVGRVFFKQPTQSE